MKTDNAAKLYTALHRIGRQLHRCAHRLGHTEGHYREQSRLLLLIAENEGVIQRDLAMEMDVRPSSMTEMLARMERMGLICRRQDEQDQRVMHIYLTDAGKAAAEESEQASARLTGRLFAGLTPEEIAEMLRLTEKLADALDALDSDDSGWGASRGSHGHHRGFGWRSGFDEGHPHGRSQYRFECDGFGGSWSFDF